jgi:hypothetical protein
VALSQARILYQNHSGDYPQVILTIPVTCRTVLNFQTNMDMSQGFVNRDTVDTAMTMSSCSYPNMPVHEEVPLER